MPQPKPNCGNCAHWKGENINCLNHEFRECVFKIPEWMEDLLEGLYGDHTLPMRAMQKEAGTACLAHKYSPQFSQ